MRVGEAALHVAEQLRFEQRVGNAGAVDGDERRRATAAAMVDQARDDLLADAALAGDQHLGVRAGGMFDFFFNTANGGTDTNHA